MKYEVPHIFRKREAARILNVSVAALRRWRREHRGPAFVKIEKCVGYRLSDIELFLAQSVRTQQVLGRDDNQGLHDE